MVDVTQNMFMYNLSIKVTDNDYKAEIDVTGGDLKPFDIVYMSNGKEELSVTLEQGKYGYFMEVNGVRYFIRFRDFNITTDKVVELAKQGYDSLKSYIMEIAKKGKEVRRK